MSTYTTRHDSTSLIIDVVDKMFVVAVLLKNVPIAIQKAVALPNKWVIIFIHPFNPSKYVNSLTNVVLSTSMCQTALNGVQSLH